MPQWFYPWLASTFKPLLNGEEKLVDQYDIEDWFP